VGVFVEVSVKATVNGDTPEVGVPVKPTTGTTAVEVPMILSDPTDPFTTAVSIAVGDRVISDWGSPTDPLTRPVPFSLLSADTGKITISIHNATITQI
jgi:hypothetical protein